MATQERVVDVPEQSLLVVAAAPIPFDAAKLEEMTKNELIELLMRIGGAVCGIAMQTPEEIAEAFKLKLAINGLGERDMFKALPIMKEWFDRTMGKAAQSVSLTVKDEGLGKLSDERLLRLERELARVTGQDAVVIAPMPKKLDDNQ